jgi:hypothetical protein
MGPSNFWVKTFNLNNRKFLTVLCIFFLILVIGVAQSSHFIENLRSNSAMVVENSPDQVAVVINAANQKIVLLTSSRKDASQSIEQIGGLTDLKLSLPDKIFLEETKKIGEISFTSVSNSSELPMLNSRSIKELKNLIETAASKPAQMVEAPQITSRIFIPGRSEIYGIRSNGDVVEIGADGQIIDTK